MNRTQRDYPTTKSIAMLMAFCKATESTVNTPGLPDMTTTLSYYVNDHGVHELVLSHHGNKIMARGTMIPGFYPSDVVEHLASKLLSDVFLSAASSLIESSKKLTRNPRFNFPEPGWMYMDEHTPKDDGHRGSFVGWGYPK